MYERRAIEWHGGNLTWNFVDTARCLKSLLVLRPMTVPNTDSGTTPRRNRLNNTMIVPNGRAAVELFAHAVELTRIKTTTQGTGNMRIVETDVQTQLPPSPLDSCRYNRLLT